jgi:hypothetical protein
MQRSEAESIIRSIPRTCRGPITAARAAQRDALLTADDLEGAAAADRAGRPGCGADFNAIVIAGPLDGQAHAYTCPTCGVSGTYTAPLFELEPAAADAAPAA